MNYKPTKKEYQTALEDIVKKAEELSNIKVFNANLEKSIMKYNEIMYIYDNSIKKLIKEFDTLKEIHIKELKEKLLKFNLNEQLNLFKDGDIFYYIDTIENYLQDERYINELEIIISINIYSKFKSIRTLGKNQYPYLHKLLNKKSYPINFTTQCPFCDKETSIDLYKRQVSSYELVLENISECHCIHPMRVKYSSLDLEKINNLVNPNTKFITPMFDNDCLNKLKNYTQEKYPNLYNFIDGSIKIYEDEQDFKFSLIDKQVWHKIKENNLNFDDKDIALLRKIPTALTYGIQLYGLKDIIENMIFEIKENIIRDYTMSLLILL